MKALFVTPKEIKTMTVIGGNVDEAKITDSIRSMQDLDLQTYLGTSLYNKLEADVLAGTLTGSYKTLMDDYVKRYLVYKVAGDYIRTGAYTVANGGIYRHEPENAIGAGASEIQELADNQNNKAEFYASRMISYLEVNQNDFPEYSEENPGDVEKSTDPYFSGWVI